MLKNSNPIEIATPVLRFIPALKPIAESLKLIEPLESKVDKPNKALLNTAIINFKYAQNASRNNKTKYLESAKDNFIKAISLENLTFDNFDNAYRIFAAYLFALDQSFRKARPENDFKGFEVENE